MQLLFASLVLLPAAVLASSYEGSALKEESLQYHNKFRTEHSAPALKWDDDVAATAQAHADKCHYGHSSNSKYGENIAAGYDSPEKAVVGWGNERDQYDFGNQGFSSECGHFTQIVWKETLTVGCGAALCDGLLGSGKQWFYVCNYEKPGNVQGQYEQNISPKTDNYKQEPAAYEDKPNRKPIAKPEPSYDVDTDYDSDNSPSYSDNEESDDEYDSDKDSDDYSGKKWQPKKWNAHKKNDKFNAYKKWNPKKWGSYSKHDSKPKYDFGKYDSGKYDNDSDNYDNDNDNYNSGKWSPSKYDSKPKYEDYTPSYN